MTVYFAYRSQYDTPTLNHIKTFEQATVFDWFKHYWNAIDDPDQADEFAQQLLGCDVYGFDSLHREISEDCVPPPNSIAKLEEYLSELLYIEGEMKFEEHAIQVLTDDDELDVAYYIFDDDYLRQRPGQASFIVRQEWELPTAWDDKSFKPAVEVRELAPQGATEGALYCVFLSAYDAGGQLSEINNSWRINGLRLPGLVEYLSSKVAPSEVDFESGFPTELLLIRSQLQGPALSEDERKLSEQITSKPTGGDASASEQMLPDTVLTQALTRCCKYPVGLLGEDIDWKAPSAQSLFLSETEVHEMAPLLFPKNTNVPMKSRLQVSAHMAQASIHTDKWQDFGHDLYNRWILFDDLWASANEDLANAILRHGMRWDVLS